MCISLGETDWLGASAAGKGAESGCGSVCVCGDEEVCVWWGGGVGRGECGGVSEGGRSGVRHFRELQF